MNPVTLQLSLAPGDHRIAETLLRHQTEFWRGAVDEILLTIDTRRSRGRFGAEWEKGRERIRALARAVPFARVLEVDYSREARHAVADEFFGNARVPTKDCRGGPYYAYFFGLHAAAHDFVLHADADLFFGGSAARWLDTARTLHAAEPDLLFLAPLPGPPAPDGKLKQLTSTPRTLNGVFGHEFATMSTRVFFFSRARFRERLGALQPRPPVCKDRALAWLDGHPRAELPENLFAEAMRVRGLRRFDFAGPAPGCWSLHPPYRCEDFFQKLPALVARVERGDLPAAQLGDHDLNASLVDWSDALARMAQHRWWHRLRARVFARRPHQP
jgi:hypothetical protein